MVDECVSQSLDIVDMFCYLGDMIAARGGAENSITIRIRSARNKFRELLPLLDSKGLPLVIKGRIYEAFVRSILLYGSEMWPVRVRFEQIRKKLC